MKWVHVCLLHCYAASAPPPIFYLEQLILNENWWWWHCVVCLPVSQSCGFCPKHLFVLSSLFVRFLHVLLADRRVVALFAPQNDSAVCSTLSGKFGRLPVTLLARARAQAAGCFAAIAPDYLTTGLRVRIQGNSGDHPVIAG